MMRKGEGGRGKGNGARGGGTVVVRCGEDFWAFGAEGEEVREDACCEAGAVWEG